MSVFVYHAISCITRNSMLYGIADIYTKEDVVRNWEGDNYSLVAEVVGNDKDLAYKLTNNITGSWVEEAIESHESFSNPSVNPAENVWELRGCRSTSVGDLLVERNADGSSKVYVVAPFGFELIEGINFHE